MRRASHAGVRRSSPLQPVVIGLWLCCAGAAWAQEPGAKTEAASTPSPEATPAPEPAPAAEAPTAQPAPTPEKPSAPAASSSAAAVRASSEGFSISSEDKSFVIKFRGYAQADGRFFLSDTDRAGSNAFLVRRARPLLEGTMFGAFDFRLLVEFAGGAASIQDAYVELRYSKALRLRAGKYKVPVGLERLLSGTSIPFLERALPSNLIPNRDIGLQLHGELLEGSLTYALNASNGAPFGGSVDANSDNSFDLVARVFTYPLKRTELRPLQGLGLGFGASRGKRLGTPTSSGLSSFRGTTQQPFFSYLASSAAADAVVADGVQQLLTPQASWYWGPLGLIAEYASAAQEVKRGAERTRLRHQSWQATAAWVLFGGNASAEGVKPTRPLSLSERAWGAVELVARTSALRIDPDTFPTFADPARSASEARNWAVGVNWYLNANVRISFNLDGTSFKGGATDADRPSETLLLSRAQVTW